MALLFTIVASEILFETFIFDMIVQFITITSIFYVEIIFEIFFEVFFEVFFKTSLETSFESISHCINRVFKIVFQTSFIIFQIFDDIFEFNNIESFNPFRQHNIIL